MHATIDIHDRAIAREQLPAVTTDPVQSDGVRPRIAVDNEPSHIHIARPYRVMRSVEGTASAVEMRP